MTHQTLSVIASIFLITLILANGGFAQETETDSVIELISRNYDGEPASWSWNPTIDHEGQRIAFMSGDANLIENTTTCPGEVTRRPCMEIYLYDRESDSVRLITIGHDGSPANHGSGSTNPVISGDGKSVAFRSFASNLVPDDTNEVWDAFVWSEETDEIERVSVNNDGQEQEGPENLGCGFACGAISLNWDGTVVVFDSWASNLVPEGEDSKADVFARDLTAGTTERLSIDSDGAPANAPSWNPSYQAVDHSGRYVVFHSLADNLDEGISSECELDSEMFGDREGCLNVFLHDRETGTTTLLSTSDSSESDADSAIPAISGDGRYVAFGSSVDGLITGVSSPYRQVYVVDLDSGEFEIVSVNNDGETADGESWSPKLSADGRYIVFVSQANNLFPGTDREEVMGYIHDRELGVTAPIVLTDDGKLPSDVTTQGKISGNGEWITFTADGGDLPDGTPGHPDVYVTNMHLQLIEEAAGPATEPIDQESSVLHTLIFLAVVGSVLGLLRRGGH